MRQDFTFYMTLACYISVVSFASGQTAKSSSFQSEGRFNDLDTLQVTLNLQQSLSTIGSRFVGVTIDSSMTRDNWETLDLSSPKVQNLARALAPTYFRLGGTQADCLTFDPDKQDDKKSFKKTRHNSIPDVKYRPELSPFNISVNLWRGLNEFVQLVGWDFIMDLNAVLRNADGSWDTTNARKLLQFSAAHNFTIAGFELGNEYEFYQSAFNRTVTPEQLAADVVSLQNLLAEFPQYYSSFIVGPETAGTTSSYFKGFLAAGGADVVRASSFHHYYLEGKTAKVQQFTEIQVLDSLKGVLESGISQSRSVNPQLPVWLSETSSAWGGGAHNISDRFVAGFLWLDKLGLSASMGIETVIRQDFYGINYALIDDQMNPNPDYWLTVLHKRLVRGSVFQVTGRPDVRIYAACANTDTFSAGALTVYFLNPGDYPVTFDLPQFKGQIQLHYILTPGDENGLVSKFTALNGVKLEMQGSDLPLLTPKMQTGPVVMPPYSFGFIVLPTVQLSMCIYV